MRHVPNAITLSRMLLSVICLLSYRTEWLFITLYIICGASDALDGYIARRTGTATAFGAKADSLADLLMFGMIIAVILMKSRDTVHLVVPLLAAAALIRAANAAVAFFRYSSFVILHTWGNKITGFLIFVSPLLLITSARTAAALVICSLAILSALEELLIHLTAKSLNLNRKSLFTRT